MCFFNYVLCQGDVVCFVFVNRIIHIYTISIKLYGGVGHDQRKNLLHFGMDQDKWADPGFFFTLSSPSQDRALALMEVLSSVFFCGLSPLFTLCIFVHDKIIFPCLNNSHI